jgi:hypothetical protein
MKVDRRDFYLTALAGVIQLSQQRPHCPTIFVIDKVISWGYGLFDGSIIILFPRGDRKNHLTDEEKGFGGRVIFYYSQYLSVFFSAKKGGDL